MHKTAVKLGVSATLALLVPFAQAAGLGRLTVNSALGQPLAAQIEIVSATRDELNSLAARLASPDAYRQANLQFQTELNALRFSIQQRPGAQPVVLITSTRPVNEPVVDLLVELAWASGRISRAYTVLIDPPATQQVAPVAPAAPPAPPVVAAEPRPAPVIEPRPAPAETAAARRELDAAADGRRPAARGSVAPAPATAPVQEYGPVKRGETLAGVATAMRPDGVSLEQMLVGLFRSNPDAFDGNMNRLKSGRILRVPDKDAVAAIPPAEALQEIRVQARDWNAYRNRLAEAAPAAREGSAASGRITSRADDQAAGNGPRDVVKLSKTEGVGAGGGKGEAAAKPSTTDRLRMLEEEAIAREKALAEAQDRIAQLEKTIREQQKLLALKATPAGTPPPEPAKTPAAPPPPTDGVLSASAPVPATAPEVARAEADVPASAPAPVPVAAPEPAAKAPVTPPPAPEPEFLDLLLEEPLYLGAGAGVLLLVLLLIMRRRRAASAAPRREPVAPASVMPAAAAGASAATAAFVAVDDQPAATREPEPLDLDLLPEPERESESGPGQTSEASSGQTPEPSADAGGRSVIPMEAPAADVPAGAVIEPVVMPDEPVVTPQEPPAEAPPEPVVTEEPSRPESVLPDFEFELPAPDEEPAAVDVTSEALEAPTAVTESNIIDFNLDLPEVEPEQEPPVSSDTTPAPAAAGNGLDFKLDFGDIDLNLDEPAAPAAGVDKEPHWHDVQQKFDLAKAYEEMGDREGAREVLQEVLNEGDEEQRGAARKLLDTLG